MGRSGAGSDPGSEGGEERLGLVKKQKITTNRGLYKYPQRPLQNYRPPISFADDHLHGKGFSIFILLASVLPSVPLSLSCMHAGKTKGECQYVSTIGGGCPDKSQCLETCRPCFRGVGHVVAYCVGPDGPFPYWECRCAFHNNAPCPPLPPPRCPRLWPPPAASSNHTSLPPN
uniref:Uncharacterized protein n=1 Tax=Manihot esculenta TaxID=3983 RepID=A0A2C9UDJ3_MANES